MQHFALLWKLQQFQQANQLIIAIIRILMDTYRKKQRKNQFRVKGMAKRLFFSLTLRP